LHDPEIEDIVSSGTPRKNKNEERLEHVRLVLRTLVHNYFYPKVKKDEQVRDSFASPKNSRDLDMKHNSDKGQSSSSEKDKLGRVDIASKLEEISSQLGIPLTTVKQEFDILFRQGKKVTLPSTLKEDRDRTSTHMYRD